MDIAIKVAIVIFILSFAVFVLALAKAFSSGPK